MKKAVYFVIILILTGTFSACGNKSEKKEINQKKLTLIKAKEVTGESFKENYKIVGTVKPYASAKLSSEEGGLITYLAKDKGDRVSKGEVVVEFKKEVDEASYNQSLAQYDLAKDNFERMEKLYLENATTEQQYTNSKLQLNIAEKSVELYRARLTTGYIISPINGVVDEKIMNKGEMTLPGLSIISIVDISRVKINAGIPERFVGQITIGQKVGITSDALPDENSEGLISYVSPTLNEQSRTFEIEIVLNNSKKRFKPEMSANIIFTRLDLDNVVVLERDLIVDNGDEKYVFVLEGDNAKKKLIKVDGTNDNKVYISEGLRIGDKLIYEGFRALADGDKVQVVNE
jgi:membrane fusion protein, multidrug efflux system